MILNLSPGSMLLGDNLHNQVRLAHFIQGGGDAVFRIVDPEIPEVTECLSVSENGDGWLVSVAVPDLSSLATDHDLLHAMAQQPKACYYHDMHRFLADAATATHFELIDQSHETPDAQRLVVTVPVSTAGKRGQPLVTMHEGASPPQLTLAEAAAAFNDDDNDSPLVCELRLAFAVALALASRRTGKFEGLNNETMELEPLGVRTLVRELTVLVNRALADELDRREVQALYRTESGYLPSMQPHNGLYVRGYLPITAPTTDPGRIVNQAIIKADLLHDIPSPYTSMQIDAYCTLFNQRRVAAAARIQRVREARLRRGVEAHAANELKQSGRFRERIAIAINEPGGKPRVSDVARLLFPTEGVVQNDDQALTLRVFDWAEKNPSWVHDLICDYLNRLKPGNFKMDPMVQDNQGRWIGIAALNMADGRSYTSRPAFGRTKKQAGGLAKLDAFMQALKLREQPSAAELDETKAIRYWMSVRRQHGTAPTDKWAAKLQATLEIYGGQITDDHLSATGSPDWSIYHARLGLQIGELECQADCNHTNQEVARRILQKRLVHKVQNRYPVTWLEEEERFFGGVKRYSPQPAEV